MNQSKKYDDRPLYVVNKDSAQEDLGYYPKISNEKRPSPQWADKVLADSRKRAGSESPLKIWWLKQERAKPE